MEKAVCPQSYFLLERRLSLSLCKLLPFSAALCLSLSGSVPFSFPASLRESAANGVVTVNSLFVLLRRGGREGFLHLIDWKIYISFSCKTKEEWIRGGRLVNGDLAECMERHSFVFPHVHIYAFKCMHSSTSFSTNTHTQMNITNFT